jgi:hypothetical protein
MKKLQLFIIIYCALLVSYTCAPDFLITSDVNSFYVDFDSSRQSALTVSKHDTPNKTSLSSKYFGHLYITGEVKTPEFQLDADIPDAPELYDHGMTLMSPSLEGPTVLMAHSPAVELFHFPSEAYRLRI